MFLAQVHGHVGKRAKLEILSFLCVPFCMIPGNSGQFILTIEYLIEQKIIYFICEGKISVIDIAEQYLM
jgi:hypothetical protein